MAHAVDRTHPQLLGRAASVAASAFLEDEAGPLTLPPGLDDVLARTQHLALRMGHPLQGRTGLDRVRAVLLATRSLTSLHVDLEFINDPGESYEPILELHNLTHVRRLVLRSSSGQLGRALSLQLPRPELLTEVTLGSLYAESGRDVAALLARCPRIEVLRLEAEMLDEGDERDFSLDALARCRNLRELVLVNTCALDHGAVAGLVSRLPYLRDLQLKATWQFENGSKPQPSGALLATPLLQLRSLRLSGFQLDHGYTNTLEFTQVPNLQTLDLRGTDFVPFPAADRPPLRLAPLKQLRRLLLGGSNLPVCAIEASGAIEAAATGRLQIVLGHSGRYPFCSAM